MKDPGLNIMISVASSYFSKLPQWGSNSQPFKSKENILTTRLKGQTASKITSGFPMIEVCYTPPLLIKTLSPNSLKLHYPCFL